MRNLRVNKSQTASPADGISRPTIPGHYWVHFVVPYSTRTFDSVVYVYRLHEDGKTEPDMVLLDSGETYPLDDKMFLKWSGPVPEPPWRCSEDRSEES